MNIALASIFRNAMPYLDRYFKQVEALGEKLMWENEVRVILAEGDSTDGTWEELQNRTSGNSRVTLLKRDHGGPLYESGSVGTQERWRQISYVYNAVLNQVKFDDDVFILVESDLIWEAQTMIRLLSQLGSFERKPNVDCVAPMVWYGEDEPGGNRIFYDSWGHRKDGVQFTNEVPYHPALKDWKEGLIELDSAGSCLVMRGEVARRCRFDPVEKGIVGFCDDIRKKGYRIWLDPSESVVHPKNPTLGN